MSKANEKQRSCPASCLSSSAKKTGLECIEKKNFLELRFFCLFANFIFKVSYFSNWILALSNEVKVGVPLFVSVIMQKRVGLACIEKSSSLS